MEISQKYKISVIEELAEMSDFQMTGNFLDQQNFYTNSLWKII